jgi:23S rRNA pseudouridine1911/1915/1917 synthase
MKPLDKENIIFCDNHILVVEKPAGMATQPDLVDWAKSWVKEEFKKPGNVFLEPAHRLDKPVSGLVLFARTSKALSRLQAMMRERSIRKTYVALVEGKLSQQGTLKHHLVHDEYRARISPEGKEAVLHYRVLETKGNLNLVEVVLETGRYHQIRAQFSAIKCPIIGDEKYGSKKSFPSGIALHHLQLEFVHPVTKNSLKISSPKRLPIFSAK